MTGVGELLFLIGVCALFASPIERALTNHRAVRVEIIESALIAAFPLAPSSPALEVLVLRAEDALNRDNFSSGIIATAATYDRANDGDAQA